MYNWLYFALPIAWVICTSLYRFTHDLGHFHIAISFCPRLGSCTPRYISLYAHGLAWSVTHRYIAFISLCPFAWIMYTSLYIAIYMHIAWLHIAFRFAPSAGSLTDRYISHCLSPGSLTHRYISHCLSPGSLTQRYISHCLSPGSLTHRYISHCLSPGSVTHSYLAVTNYCLGKLQIAVSLSRPQKKCLCESQSEKA